MFQVQDAEHFLLYGLSTVNVVNLQKSFFTCSHVIVSRCESVFSSCFKLTAQYSLNSVFYWYSVHWLHVQNVSNRPEKQNFPRTLPRGKVQLSFHDILSPKILVFFPKYLEETFMVGCSLVQFLNVEEISSLRRHSNRQIIRTFYYYKAFCIKTGR